MGGEAELRDRPRKIEALFAGAGTLGEKIAAVAALERVRAHFANLQTRDERVEMQFFLGDQWSRQLFLALWRRYGLKRYRGHRQRRTTVMLKAPKAFMEQVVWPEIQELDEALRRYLSEVTARIIREEVHMDVSEAIGLQASGSPPSSTSRLRPTPGGDPTTHAGGSPLKPTFLFG